MGGTSSKQTSNPQQASTQKLDEQWFAAIKSNDVNKVKELLPSVEVNLTDTRGRTGLCHVKNKEIAEFLIAKGANVNAKDKRKFTPLHYAQNREIAEVLMKNGADLEALSENPYPNGPRHTPLSSALTCDKKDVALCLIDNFSLEQLQEKPNFLNFQSNFGYSQYWDQLKQKKETEKDNSEALETGMSVGKLESTLSDIATSTTTQAQATIAMRETADQSRFAQSTLFTSSTETEEELAKTEKEKRYGIKTFN